jgi:hypothetical protein
VSEIVKEGRFTILSLGIDTPTLLRIDAVEVLDLLLRQAPKGRLNTVRGRRGRKI